MRRRGKFAEVCTRPEATNHQWEGRNYEIVCAYVDTKGLLWTWDTNDATAPDLSQKVTCEDIDIAVRDITPLNIDTKPE